MKIQRIAATYLLLCLASCSYNPPIYDSYDQVPAQAPMRAPIQAPSRQVNPNYYRQDQQQQPYQQPNYQQQPYQQNPYEQNQPQQGGSRNYSNPYDIPPTPYYGYDADQYYVPPTNYGTEPYHQSITEKH
jgi:hypothetical protein